MLQVSCVAEIADLDGHPPDTLASATQQGR